MTNKFNSENLKCPAFFEIKFPILGDAIHPTYTLDIDLPGAVKTEAKESYNESQAYCMQLFEKFISLPTYDYGPFIFYHLDMKTDRREWLESCLILVTNNKELFYKFCEVEKYIYLIKLINRLYNVHCTESQLPLYENCEECRHKFVLRVLHDIKILENIPHVERKYFLQKIIHAFKQFDNIRNLKFEDALFEQLNYENDQIELSVQRIKDLNDQRENIEKDEIKELKKITAKCSAVDCGKIIGDFLNSYQDKNGAYVFEFDNTTLSKLIVTIFHFTIGKQVCDKTMRDYLPSKRKND